MWTCILFRCNWTIRISPFDAHVVTKDYGILVLFLVWFMLFNTTFNNISVISWRSVLLVEETAVPGEKHRTVASHCQTLSHNVMLYREHLAMNGVWTHNLSGLSQVVVNPTTIRSRPPLLHLMVIALSSTYAI